MKILYLFALSLSATISLVVVSPAIVQAEGTRSAQAPVPKPDPLPAIIQQEAALLKRTQTSNTAEQMRTLYRQVVADTLEFYSSRSPSPAVPSSETTVYFGDLCHRYPQSGILSILFAESLAAQKDDFGQVAPIYQDAIKAHPNHPLLASRYADYLQRQGTQRGIAVLEQAIRAQPQNFNAYLDLAYFQQGDPGLTIAVFDRSIAAFPKNTQVYTQFAKIALDRHYDKGYLTEIIDRVIVAKKNFPQNSDLDVLLVGLYKQVGQTPMAIDMLKQASRKGGDPRIFNPKIFNLLLAELYIQNNQTDEALNYYRQTLKAGGNLCYDQFSDRAQTLQTQGKAKQAWELLSESLRINATNPEAVDYCVANLYQLTERHPEFRQGTIDVLRPIMSQSATGDGMFALLSLMMEQQQYTEVITVGSARINQPKLIGVGALGLMGNAAKALKKFDQAEKFYLAAEAIARENHQQLNLKFKHPELLSGARWHIGTMRLAQGKTDQAIAQFNLAIEGWPEIDHIGSNQAEVSFKAIAYNSLGEIAQTQGKTQEARGHFEAAIADSKDYLAAQQNMAKLR